MKLRTIIITALLALPFAGSAAEQEPLPRWGLKTNLLWDATGSVNIAAEFKLGGHTSFELPVSYNSWSWTPSRKWKHLLVQPELRLWPRETFRGSFFGLHAHWGMYNVAGLPLSDHMRTHRFEGQLVGGGLSWGYRWNLKRRWALEATIGVGYAWLDYNKYECGECGTQLKRVKKHYVGPTRAGLALVFGMGRIPQRPVVVEPVLPPPPPPVVIVIPDPMFVIPPVEQVKVRHIDGRAYIDYRVARHEILPDFRLNGQELGKIYSSIERVMGDRDITVTGISIVGHASPEGTWESNLALSERRSQALAAHLRSRYGALRVPFDVHGQGEDWEGLASLVADSGIPERGRILDIIRNVGIFQGRETRLKEIAGGAVWRQMLADMFPTLRRSDYRIDYTVVPFTVERGLSVLAEDPSKLSLNEMFLIAQRFEAGSEEFNAIFKTAARLFPSSAVAAVNAAASALQRRDLVSAAYYLDQADRALAAARLSGAYTGVIDKALPHNRKVLDAMLKSETNH